MYRIDFNKLDTLVEYHNVNNVVKGRHRSFSPCTQSCGLQYKPPNQAQLFVWHDQDNLAIPPERHAT